MMPHVYFLLWQSVKKQFFPQVIATYIKEIFYKMRQLLASANRQQSPVLCVHQGLFILYCYIPCDWNSCHLLATLCFDPIKLIFSNNLFTYQHNRIFFLQHVLKWKMKMAHNLHFLLITILWHPTQPLIQVSTESLKKKGLWILFTYFSHHKLSQQCPSLSKAKSLKLFFKILHHFSAPPSTENYSIYERQGTFCLAFSSANALLLLRKPYSYYPSVLPTHAEVLPTAQ